MTDTFQVLDHANTAISTNYSSFESKALAVTTEAAQVASEATTLLDLFTGNIEAAQMTSLEIAELTGARHSSVKRSIERLAESAVILLPPPVEVSVQRERREEVVEAYIFTGESGYTDCLIVVAQLSPEFTAKIVHRWRELERENLKLKLQLQQEQEARLKLVHQALIALVGQASEEVANAVSEAERLRLQADNLAACAAGNKRLGSWPDRAPMEEVAQANKDRRKAEREVARLTEKCNHYKNDMLAMKQKLKKAVADLRVLSKDVPLRKLPHFVAVYDNDGFDWMDNLDGEGVVTHPLAEPTPENLLMRQVYDQLRHPQKPKLEQFALFTDKAYLLLGLYKDHVDALNKVLGIGAAVGTVTVPVVTATA